MALAPTLRIDYIFADNRWQIVQCKTIATSASDHLPVVADLQKVK
jgi:endonuclease/exonuclease/phosphatase family metal-dependent hydrolase